MANKQTTGRKSNKKPPVMTSSAPRKVVPASFEKVTSGGKSKNKVRTPSNNGKVEVITNDIIVFQNRVPATAIVLFLPSEKPSGVTGQMKLLDPVDPSEEIGVDLEEGYRYVTLPAATALSKPTVSFIASHDLSTSPSPAAKLKRRFRVLYPDDADGPITLMGIGTKVGGDPEIIIEG